MELKNIQNTNDLRLNKRYEILTPDGFQPFYGVRKVLKKEWFRITFSDGSIFEASGKHVVELAGGRYCEVRNLGEGAIIKGVKNKVVVSLEFKQEPVWMYDIVDTPGHLYMVEGIVSHNCDFMASGDTAFETDDMTFYEQTYQQDPVERRGIDGNLWIWEYPDYTKTYMISADVARGDGADFSACQVWDVEACTQVAEYKGQLTPRDFGAMLTGLATEYNNALLVIENANVGWSTIEEVIHREYPNLFYGDNSTLDTAESYASKMDRGKLTPGFTTSMKTRPLVISKMYDYIHQKAVILRSKRLMLEMRTFIWKNGKAQAAEGYNDDLVMSCGIGLFVRDTALRLRQQGIDLSRAQMSSFSNLNRKNPAIVQASFRTNPFEMKDPHGNAQDIRWLLG